jgi:hypothetical protein
MKTANRNKTPPPAWSGSIVRARLGPSLSRGRGPASKSVGAFVPGLTRKAFEKFGFSTASLIMDWPRVAGPDVAQWTTPERVKWPQGYETAELAQDSGARPGATLVLRVDPARALDVEYRARQIIERINAYFGYRAIAELHILQAPLPGHAITSSHPSTSPVPQPRQSSLPDDPLARALARMEARVKGETHRP